MLKNEHSEPSVASATSGFSSELNIESLISAPLIAVSKANVAMVTGQTRFLLEYCFNENKETKTHEPKMITMVLTKSIVDSTKDPGDLEYIRLVPMNFVVPLLCLVPLNSLAVDKVAIDFNMEITSVNSYESNKGILNKKAVLNGKISSSNQESDSNKSQYRRQVSNTLKVNVNAGPLPLPMGVLTILDMYTKAIQPSQPDK